jgi:hypothetical protein
MGLTAVRNQTGPLKRSHLEASPYVSLSYWSDNQDTGQAGCRATWAFDHETRNRVWDLFRNGPEPVGYDPRIVAAWTAPTVDAFAALRLDPWRLRVFPGTVLLRGEGDGLTWQAD